MPPLESLIRVNQAGEYGATRIYAGQLAVLKDKTTREVLYKMKDQEQEHLKLFNDFCLTYSVSPTLFTPLWHTGGYLLGVVTALLGAKAAHACTIAVEDVIADHYQNQLIHLSKKDHPDLYNAITHCRGEELKHKEEAIDQGGMDAPFYQTLTKTVKHISKMAIWLSKRL